MNITEADHTARLLDLLDGKYAGGNPEQLLESVEYLRGRAEKPLQVSIRLNVERVRQNILDLHRHTRGGQAVTS